MTLISINKIGKIHTSPDYVKYYGDDMFLTISNTYHKNAMTYKLTHEFVAIRISGK